MDYFKNFVTSFFPNRGHRTPPNWLPPDEYPEDDLPQHAHTKSFPWAGSEDEGMPRGGFGGFPTFPRHFEDAMKDMDDTFDELFKIFGVDNIPMFDPYIPPSHDGQHWPGPRQAEQPPPDGNVRDKMLKGAKESPYEDGDVNVRSKMLRKNPTPDPSVRSRASGQNDVNWDALLKEGGTVNDILDGSGRSAPSGGDWRQEVPRTRSVFRYSSVTTTRKPDGTVETRRVTRDESGNEKETVEIKGGPS